MKFITTKTKGSKEYDADKPYIKRFRGTPYPRKGLEIYRFVPFVGRKVRHVKKLPKFDYIEIKEHTQISKEYEPNLWTCINRPEENLELEEKKK